MYLAFSILAALAYTFGGVCMKKSDGLKQLTPSLLIFLFFFAGAGLQAVSMRKAELGVTYLFVLGLESILAFAFGALLFQEEFSWWKLSGVALIVAGIFLLHVNEL
jgi:small multidrug resistance pump/quaternary ammonium compound-resistance protein SugE